MNTSEKRLVDDCAVKSAFERRVVRNSVLWFMGAIMLGGYLTYSFARMDRWMYDHNGEFLDNVAYRQNRLAATLVGTDQIDERQRGDLVQSRGQLPNGD